jgi:aminopeptidase N
VLLDGTRSPIPVALADPSGPVVVNAGGSGFYRVGYDDALRSRLDRITVSRLTTLERYNLIDDAWAATVAGRFAAADLLEFLEAFGSERDHAVWQAIVIALRGLNRLLDDGPAHDAFQGRVRDLVAPVLSALGEPTAGEADLTGKLRGLLVGAQGVLGGDIGVQARCREWFDRAAVDPASVDPELTAAATSVVAAMGDADTYAHIRRVFVTSSNPQEQLRHLYALAEFDDEQLVLDTCEFAMSPAVRTQNAPFLLRTAIANRRHGPSAWAFVRDHWDDAIERFPANTIVRMVDSVRLLNRPELVEETARFFADHPIAQSAKTLEQMLERQRVNTALRSREQHAFSEALIAGRVSGP